MGAAINRREVPVSTIEHYRGRLPDRLLAYWREHGWCGYRFACQAADATAPGCTIAWFSAALVSAQSPRSSVEPSQERTIEPWKRRRHGSNRSPTYAREHSGLAGCASASRRDAGDRPEAAADQASLRDAERGTAVQAATRERRSVADCWYPPTWPMRSPNGCGEPISKSSTCRATVTGEKRWFRQSMSRRPSCAQPMMAKSSRPLSGRASSGRNT